MDKNILNITCASLLLVAVLAVVVPLLPVFADNIKCKDNEDNNCNNTIIVQKIIINNNCNIANDNTDHSSNNVNVNQLQCSTQYANIYGSLINAPVFSTIFENGSNLNDPFAPIT